MKRVLILSANTALVVVCCWLLAIEIIVPIIDAFLTPDGVSIDSGAAAAADSPRGPTDRQVILTRNLFNVSTLSPTAIEDEDVAYEKTKLPLRLLGTAAAPDAALSWAAIEDLETKAHLVVRVDQEIKGGARVLKIERRRIVLMNAGRPETLDLEGDTSAPRTAQAKSRPNARGNLQRLAENRFAVDRSEVQNLATNPSALFSQARILPKYEGGQMVGVQVSGIKPGSLFEQAGLQNGDTITEVNGQPVNGPEGAPVLFQKLTQGGPIEIGGVGPDGKSFSKSFVSK